MFNRGVTRFETSPFDTANAYHAFETLDALPPETQSNLVRVDWEQEPNRANHIDRETIEPRFFAVARERALTETDTADLEIRQCLERWADNIHLMNILRRHLNPESRRFTLVTDMMRELTRQAIVGNAASTIATHLDIHADPSKPPQQTTFAIWDNGTSAEPDEIRSRYLSDRYYDFSRGTWQIASSERDASQWPTLAIRSAIGSRASVTIASGDHALDLNPADNHDELAFLTIDEREIEPITGNAVVVRLPHTSSSVR